MGRAPCCDKANVKRGPWSVEEDTKLKSYIEEHGTGGNWIALPTKIGLKRCGKSCRLRWLNYLRPNIKHGGFSEEEDNVICRLYISIGSRWSIIAAQLPGRTDNDIKNYWNTRLKKKIFGRRKDFQSKEKKEGKDPAAELSVSAIERMQLHLQLQGFNKYNSSSFWQRSVHPLDDDDDDHHQMGSIQTQNHPHFLVSDNQTINPTYDTKNSPPDVLPKYFASGLDDQDCTNRISSEAFGLQEELRELINGANFGCNFDHLQVNDQPQIIYDQDGYREKSSSSSWESNTDPVLDFNTESIFHDYNFEYGMLRSSDHLI